ncbi:MAG: amino acid ABC transporter permease [Thermoanaerobacterales bacterium]|nr:amino acid ABC transporter permease [Bacillota bacterium]MDI6908001.1 amino acid ABC transporter permease [Thermoanaerobacterales bacterium]
MSVVEFVGFIFPLLLAGTVITLELTVLSVGIGCVIGLFAGLARLSRSRFLRVIATCYVDFLRGTPLLVQILIVYFGIPYLVTDLQDWWHAALGWPILIKDPNLPRFWAAVTACSLNSGAYIAEIFRAGVQSIERGQMEAARSLGMTQSQAMRYVILPQAFKRVVPPLGNEFIAMLKDTSLVSMIGVEELLRRGTLINADYYRPFETYITVAFIYLMITLSFSRLVDYLERRLKTGDRG